MEKVARRSNGKPRLFCIYTEEEAKALDLQYVYWQNVSDEPYALTDDAYVADVISVKWYGDRAGHRRKMVKLSIGVGFAQPGRKIEFLVNRAYKDYTSLTPRSWVEREARTSRTKNVVTAYVKQFLTGSLDYQELGKIYRKDQQIPAATVKRLLKQTKVKAMIDKEMERVFEERGVSKGFVVDVIKKAIEFATQHEDPSNMLKGAEQLGSYLDMKPKGNTREIVEYGITRELGEAAMKIDMELEGKTPVGGTIEPANEVM